MGKYRTLIKKFLICKEIQSGAVAESYMRKGFLIYEELRKYFPIYEEAVSHILHCNCSTLIFLTYEENLIFFFISVPVLLMEKFKGGQQGAMVVIRDSVGKQL